MRRTPHDTAPMPQSGELTAARTERLLDEVGVRHAVIPNHIDNKTEQIHPESLFLPPNENTSDKVIHRNPYSCNQFTA